MIIRTEFTVTYNILGYATATELNIVQLVHKIGTNPTDTHDKV